MENLKAPGHAKKIYGKGNNGKGHGNGKGKY